MKGGEDAFADRSSILWFGLALFAPVFLFFQIQLLKIFLLNSAAIAHPKASAAWLGLTGSFIPKSLCVIFMTCALEAIRNTSDGGFDRLWGEHNDFDLFLNGSELQNANHFGGGQDNFFGCDSNKPILY